MFRRRARSGRKPRPRRASRRADGLPPRVDPPRRVRRRRAAGALRRRRRARRVSSLAVSERDPRIRPSASVDRGDGAKTRRGSEAGRGRRESERGETFGHCEVIVGYEEVKNDYTGYIQTTSCACFSHSRSRPAAEKSCSFRRERLRFLASDLIFQAHLVVQGSPLRGVGQFR